MKLEFTACTGMYADLISHDRGKLVLAPHRYTKTQRTVPALVFKCLLDNGDEVESGVISVDARTGCLKIERMTEEVGFDVES